MERKNLSDFRKFCESDIGKLRKETDPSKRAHLMRLINMQMYAEASKQNYDDYTICKMFSDDLDEYIEQSIPVHEANLQQLMSKLKIQLKPASIQPSFSPNDMLNSKKCDGTCKNDLLLADLDDFFNLMKKPPENHPSTSKTSLNNMPARSNARAPDKSVRMSIDNSNGDLVLETNFRRKNNPVQTSTTFQRPSSSSSENHTFQNQSMFSNHPNNHYKSNASLSADAQVPFNKYASNPFFATKRKPNETGYNPFKRPEYLPTQEPMATDQNESHRNDFKSASEELAIQYNKKFCAGNQNDNIAYNTNPNGGLRRSLGGRRTVNNKFVPPFANQENSASNSCGMDEVAADHRIDMSHPRLKNVDAKMIENITNEIMDQCDRVEWDSIAGLEYPKSVITEAVILPILRPDIFTGLRQPPRGVLLFGPPGTGKTLIGKCIASQSESTFFSISASSLTSKWIGEGEKMVRALFAVAAAAQPSVVFIDEVDSLLSQRSDQEHESSRRMKTEFLVQLDGASTTEKDRILIIGATNRPQELDEAARRRFVKRLHIPLPDLPARIQIMRSLLLSVNHLITETHMEEIARRTNGYSGADMKIVCQEAVMGPVRSISFKDVKNFAAENVRPVNFSDFLNALNCVRASVSQDDLQQYVDWNNKYGSGK